MNREIVSFKPLKVESIVLSGRHLIEASAGTGKTFSIARLYLRLLIEKNLTVQQILVMTFTRDATEELRGRIRDEIYSALHQWGNYPEEESFFASLQQQFPIEHVTPILNNALLHMDEASIFTIHGFCNRVLTEHAFASGLEFSVQMEVNTQDIELEAIRDFYRLVSKNDIPNFQLLHSHWDTPESFYQAFRSVLSDNGMLTSMDVEALTKEVKDAKSLALEELHANKEALIINIINSHKDKAQRLKEWEAVLGWFGEDTISGMPKLVKDFLNGNRYRKAENKLLVAQTLSFKAMFEHMLKQIEEAKAYRLAHTAIETIRASIVREKNKQKMMNFDDLVSTLSVTLSADTSGRFASLIRKQFPLALVDEFQDTDPQQFHILDTIYSQTTDDNGLFMIGDPKQAIYGFRGGDIFAYLKAREQADHAWVMDTNWRSTAEMIMGYNRLFNGSQLPPSDSLTPTDGVFGFGIQYLPVKPSPKAHSSTINDNYQALQFAYFPVNDSYTSAKGESPVNTAPFRQVIARWCASEISRLLTQGLSVSGQNFSEQDIAILVRSGSEAKEIENALYEIGINSVYLSNKENVFNSVQALEFYTAIDGILEFENTTKMLAAISTRYLGGTSDLLANMQEDESVWESSLDRMKSLRDLWTEQGFMSMALALVHDHYIPEPSSHERSMTNTIHLIELLQAVSAKHKQPLQLVHYLKSQIEIQTLQSEAELRLESDENLIKIVTQHGCKGLEYPIVFIPFASKFSDPTRLGTKALDIHYYHDENGQSVRQLGQALTGLTQAKDEGLAETVRLFYVSVTRAVQRCYVGVTPFDNAHLSPLGRTLQLDHAEDLLDGLTALAVDEPTAIGLDIIEDIVFDTYQLPDACKPSNDIRVATFTGDIETNWKLSSFSSLTRNVKHVSAVSAPERTEDTFMNDSIVSKSFTPELRFTLKKGADTGNLLHDILEMSDFSQPDFERSSALPLIRYPYFPHDHEFQDLYIWLADVIASPLPSIQGSEGFTLSDISHENALKEVEFYFPVTQVKITEIAKVLAKHRGVDPEQVIRRLPSHNELKGMMHGFIDLIVNWQDCYYVIDYKSTHLGDTVEDYNRATMSADIQKNFYDLQYILYTLALHRFLKKKLPDYDPSIHLGGVYYLYLRGMRQSDSSGVYANSIEVHLLEELDAVFTGQSDIASRATNHAQ